MTGDGSLQTAALRSNGAVPRSSVVDPLRVARLTAHLREMIFTVRTADGDTAALECEPFYDLLWALAHDETRRLVAEIGGRYDIILRVETREETA